MGTPDRISNKGEKAGGKIKETAGSATGDEQLEAEGKADQTKASFKDKVEDAKDKVAETFNNVTNSDD